MGSLPQPNESNPSTPPPQPAPELSFGTTPIKLSPYSALKALKAARAHGLAGLALHTTVVEPDVFWKESLNNYNAVPLSEDELTILRRQYCKLALLLKTRPKPPESKGYVPTTIIMNVLSLAHARANPLPDNQNAQVVGWFLNPTQLLFGDPFAKSLKPDIVAYLVPKETAEAYLARLQSKCTLSDLNDLRPAWAQMISAAELKASASGQSQLLNYLEAICCYRPDLASVFALSSNLRGYQFYSLNAACCSKYPDVLPWKDENTPSLQQFIAAVYQTQRSRYEKMNYLPGSLQAWSIEDSSQSEPRCWHMLPFHAGHYPGRGTWVACAIDTADLSPQPGVYIVKIYWADTRSRWNEGELYEDAHKDSQIPGLARVVDHWKTGHVVEGIHKPGGAITKREQVCVILGSTGLPLNECKSVDQILGVHFDVLETLRAMRRRDVIHRDISWGNVMINPTHVASAADPVVDLGTDSNDLWYMSRIRGQGASRPLSLLTDLDHSAKLRDLMEDVKAGRLSRTGTPMFTAMEIASNAVRWGPFPSTEFVEYAALLSDSSEHPRLKSLSLRVIAQIAHIEAASSNAKSSLPPSTAPLSWHTMKVQAKPVEKPPLVHAPRHDAESVFWLLWFVLARANPLGKDHVGEGSCEEISYNEFCSLVLNHIVGAERDIRELWAGATIEQYRQVLHPSFAHLGDMLYYMGHYFLIDPKLWSDHKDPDHAFYFMEFLLLGEMLREEEKLPLNTTEPRPATEPEASVRMTPLPVDSRGSHNYSTSLTRESIVSYSTSSSASKRKADTSAEDSLPNKRPNSLPSSSTAPAEPHRTSRRGSHREQDEWLAASQTGIRPEIVRPENPFDPTPNGAEVNQEGGHATEDENEGTLHDDIDVEEAEYVASQETPKTVQDIEQERFKTWSKSLVQAMNAAHNLQLSVLRGEQWFTVFPV